MPNRRSHARLCYLDVYGRTMLQSDREDDPLVGRLLDAVLAQLSPDLRQQVVAELDGNLALAEAWSTLFRDAKLTAVKQLAYGASHEINNPLANIASRAQSLLLHEADPDRRRQLATIYAQAMRGHAMIADLMLFARPPAPQLAPFDVVAAIQETVDSLQEAATAQATAIRLNGPAALTLAADKTQISAATAAAIQNSLDAISAGGEILVRVAALPEYCEIVVADDGAGASAEVRAQAFDPFFSGREAGRGLGFGLTKCWTIAQTHHGSVAIRPHGDGGAQVCLRIPWDLSADSAEKED
ncbi:MAG: sensor histidine kinase [Blastopirellula sp. JB062]